MEDGIDIYGNYILPAATGVKNAAVSLFKSDDAPGDYSSRRASLARQQKLAEALSQMGAQEQGVYTAGGITAPVSPMGALARGLTSFGGAYLSGKAAADEAALKKAETADALAQIGKLYTLPDKTGLVPSTAPAGTTPTPLTVSTPTLPGQKPSDVSTTINLDLPNAPRVQTGTIPGGARPYAEQQQMLNQWAMGDNSKLAAIAPIIAAQLKPEYKEVGAGGLVSIDPSTGKATTVVGPKPPVPANRTPFAAVVNGKPGMFVYDDAGNPVAVPGMTPFRTGGNGDTNPGFQQAQSAFMLPDGTKVTPVFDKRRGYGTVDNGVFTPLPKGSRPVTLGAGGPMPMAQVVKLKQDFINEDTALNRMNRYFKTVGDADVGFARWADKVSGNFRTAVGNKTLSPEQLSAQVGQGQLQGLLGLFRTDIVGPGVMTEYDAERVISALGGDFSQLQNPAVVKKMLTDLYQDKQRRLDAYQADLNYNKPYYSTLGFPSRTSSTSLGGEAPAEQKPGGAAAAGGALPKVRSFNPATGKIE